jgi:hypothetical protein
VRRRTGGPEGGELRAEVAARLRARAAEWEERLGPNYAAEARLLAREPRARAERLEAGEPVEVYGWELPSEHPAYSGSRSYVLAPDGSVQPQ